MSIDCRASAPWATVAHVDMIERKVVMPKHQKQASSASVPSSDLRGYASNADHRASATGSTSFEGTMGTSQSKGPNHKKHKRGGRGWRVLFWVALVVCLGSLIALGVIAWSYWQADHTYKDIASHALITEPDQTTRLSDMTVDWDYLRSINPDVVAWVYMPGTNINYPVVQGNDNDEYLHKDFGGAEGLSARSGTIFLDENNDPTFADANNVLYGHHMNDGSMFASLSTQLADNDEFNAHRSIYVLTPTMNYSCSTFALVLTTGDDMIVREEFQNPEDMKAYAQDKIDRSATQPSEGTPSLDTLSKMFTFSTCDYTQYNGRAVLFSSVVDRAVPNGANTGSTINPDDQAVVDQAVKEAA
ncbi:MAG: class B sortase [Eggerthellaceae bacterium]|nr:class B sortase [Eggerthellaceae bacterium]MCH4221376.1 class B sortase [Eggerthellaceae bacterium]